jgi:hypothetical protein
MFCIVKERERERERERREFPYFPLASKAIILRSVQKESISLH